MSGISLRTYEFHAAGKGKASEGTGSVIINTRPTPAPPLRVSALNRTAPKRATNLLDPQRLLDSHNHPQLFYHA